MWYRDHLNWRGQLSPWRRHWSCVVGHLSYLDKHPNTLADVVIVSLGVLINHKQISAWYPYSFLCSIVIEVMIRIAIGNILEEPSIPPKTLSGGPNAILIPLYNSNLAKVYIVKWSQNLNVVTRNSVSGIPKLWKKKHFSHFLVC